MHPAAFRNKKILLIGLSILLSGALIAGIVYVLLLILGTSGPKQNNEVASDSATSFDSGTVSQLTGGVASYRNLKGLTLRINQIDTCDASTVTAYISVSSEAGVVNKNFDKNDVSVYLDGKKISNFEFNPVDTKRSPLSNMLLVDHSGSMDATSMQSAKDAGKQYVNRLQSGDRAGLIQFDHIVEQLVPLTTDKAQVSTALDAITPRGDTAIFDALGLGIASAPDCGRKTVTVLTDGQDTASKTQTLASSIEAASKKNMPIFAVGIKSPNFDPSAIREIAEKSGGQYLEADTPAKIASLYDNIDGQLDGQFVANFRVSLKKSNSKHTIKIISNIEGSDTGSERVFYY